MVISELGNAAADIVLIQPVDDHDLSLIKNECRLIAGMTRADFRLIAVGIGDWNSDLSPWKAPAVFGHKDFGNGAERTLAAILELCFDKSKRYYLGGYSLAGLFALWAAYQTEVFRGVAAASPSMWFPGFVGYMKEHTLRCGAVYLSLGDREEKARNPVMATVGDRIREAHQVLKERGIPCRLEWNEGNHFRDADVRTAKGFAYLLNIGQS